MSFNDLHSYVAVWSINGTPHAITGFAASGTHATQAVKNIIDRRNEDFPHEASKLHQVYFKIDPAEAIKIIDKVKAANKDGTLATDLFADPNMLLNRDLQGNPPEGQEHLGDTGPDLGDIASELK